MAVRLESHYTIAWIAPLPHEHAAAKALLDDRHDTPDDFYHPTDDFSYTWGRMGKHNIVIVSLPAGTKNLVSASVTASILVSSLHHIRIGLLVGIGGGIPCQDLGHDIRLGDVVVSQPQGTSGGVVQYDQGRAHSNQTWELRGPLNMPPAVLLNALANLQSEHEIADSRIPAILQAMHTANPRMNDSEYRTGYVHQNSTNDKLFKPRYSHIGEECCSQCDESELIGRDRRESTNPAIHYGVIASGNAVVKDALTRDRIAGIVGEGRLCVETEAAGLMNHFPCLVIRGISDYADCHKNDRWQKYAAATAAAYAKELLEFVPVRNLQLMPRVGDMFRKIDRELQSIQRDTSGTRERVQGLHMDQKAVLDRLPTATGASYGSFAEAESPTCLPETRVALLEKIMQWVHNEAAESVFWLNGMAGTGKSTISRTVAQSVAEVHQLGASFFQKIGSRSRDIDKAIYDNCLSISNC
ncbi:hypothetical protein ACHAPJ_001991 [Fusarium lateritium]